MLNEMNVKSLKLKSFLDGAQANLPDKNLRSQDTNLSWLNPKSHGLKAQKRIELVAKYVYKIKSRKNKALPSLEENIKQKQIIEKIHAVHEATIGKKLNAGNFTRADSKPDISMLVDKNEI